MPERVRFHCQHCHILRAEQFLRYKDCEDCADGIKHRHYRTCFDGGHHTWVADKPYVHDGIYDPF